MTSRDWLTPDVSAAQDPKPPYEISNPHREARVFSAAVQASMPTSLATQRIKAPDNGFGLITCPFKLLRGCEGFDCSPEALSPQEPVAI